MRQAHRMSTASVLVLAALAAACAELRRAAEIGDLESQRDVVTARVVALETSAGRLRSQSLEHQDAIARHRIRTRAYMMNHKRAVAAIATTVGGGAVALDPNNAFTGEARLLAGGLGLLAAAWAIENRAEVAEVTDALIQADRHLKQLEAAASRVDAELATTMAELESARGELDAINTRLAQLRIE